MRIVFFGTPELAVPTLAAVAAVHDVVALVCRADRPKGRGKKLVAPPAKVWAAEHGIEVAQPTKLNDGTFEAWLEEQRPDICVVAAYGRMLKQPLLDVPAKGFMNLHPSLLPRHRGPSPIQGAILHGDTTTGVTIMDVILEMDAGGILLQEPLPIDGCDTTATLSQKLAELGAGLMVKGLELVESGEASFTPQDESKVTATKLYEKADGRIRWAAPARDIHNLVRAAIPWPVAHCGFKGQTVRIHETEVAGDSEPGPSGTVPGTVVRVEKDAVLVATGATGAAGAAGEGLLAIRAIQAPGKRVLPVGDYLRGHPIQPGDRFEDL